MVPSGPISRIDVAKSNGLAGELPVQRRVKRLAAGDLAGERSHAHGQVRPERGGRPICLRCRSLPGHEALHAHVRLAGKHLIVGKLPILRQPAAHLARRVVDGVVDAILPDTVESVVQRRDLFPRHVRRHGEEVGAGIVPAEAGIAVHVARSDHDQRVGIVRRRGQVAGEPTSGRRWVHPSRSSARCRASRR